MNNAIMCDYSDFAFRLFSVQSDRKVSVAECRIVKCIGRHNIGSAGNKRYDSLTVCYWLFVAALSIIAHSICTLKHVRSPN